MIKKIVIFSRLIVFLVVLILVVYVTYFYVIKTMTKARAYSYNIVELNMQVGMNSYLLSDYESFDSSSSIKLTLSDLIKGNYLKKSSVPSECNDNKSYIIGFINNKEITYKICLICNGYKIKNC